MTLQERLRQMASIAITHPLFTDYVNNALEAALEAADALNQKDAEIERLQAVVDAADRVYADYEDDCNIQSSWMSLGKALAALEVDDE